MVRTFISWFLDFILNMRENKGINPLVIQSNMYIFRNIIMSAALRIDWFWVILFGELTKYGKPTSKKRKKKQEKQAEIWTKYYRINTNYMFKLTLLIKQVLIESINVIIFTHKLFTQKTQLIKISQYVGGGSTWNDLKAGEKSKQTNVESSISKYLEEIEEMVATLLFLFPRDAIPQWLYGDVLGCFWYHNAWWSSIDNYLDGDGGIVVGRKNKLYEIIRPVPHKKEQTHFNAHRILIEDVRSQWKHHIAITVSFPPSWPRCRLSLGQRKPEAATFQKWEYTHEERKCSSKWTMKAVNAWESCPSQA